MDRFIEIFSLASISFSPLYDPLLSVTWVSSDYPLQTDDILYMDVA
jgi:hypothetical protein